MKNVESFLTILILIFLENTDADNSLRRCYVCMKNCENPEETVCALKKRHYECFSQLIKKDNADFEVKGCVQEGNDKFKEICKKVDNVTGQRCRICNTDLCNSGKIRSLLFSFWGILIVVTVRM